MKPRFVLSALAIVIPVLVSGAEGISPVSYLAHIKFLASDELAGRGDGSEGLEKAADYIASEFRDARMIPGGDQGTFDQSFETDVRVEPPATSALVIQANGGEDRLALGDQYYPLSIIDRSHGEPEPKIDRAPLVFAGFGIRAPALHYDDYAGVDVRGKAVLVFTHEPQESDPLSPFEGKSLTPGAMIAVKAREAADRGAVLLLVVDDPAHHIEYSVSRTWWSDPQSEELPIPVLRLPRARLAPYLPGLDLDRAGAFIDRTLEPQSQLLPGISVSYTEHRARLHARLRNIVGFIPGADPERGREAIVIGSHYDHLGFGGASSDAPEATGAIHNGADDNASGTAAMIEACRTLAEMQPRPSRTIICAAFAGEEIGLLGSMHYLTKPPRAIENTVAMINLDMVGRAHGRVMVSVAGAQPWMGDIRKTLRTWTRMTIDDFSHGGYTPGSSDDDSFMKRGVPTIAFFTGFHADYHRPSDDWPKIDADGGARISQLAMQLAQALAK